MLPSLALGAQESEDAAAACSPEEAELQACMNDILDVLKYLQHHGLLSTAFVRAINIFIVQRVRSSCCVSVMVLHKPLACSSPSSAVS